MYQPNPLPDTDDLKSVSTALWDELQKIANEFSTGVPFIQLEEQHAAPSRPADGMIVLADGTDWNPGSGAGYYGYQGGSWTFLG